MFSWDAWVLENELSVRLFFFFGILCLMATWEGLKPCRELHYSRWYRWRNNLALVLVNSLILRLLFPVAAAGVALSMERQGYGLLNQFELPLAISVFVAVILLDLLIYAQHVLFHKVPFLWALHKVHHADPDYDVTTGARFHPIEIILSMLIKMLAIVILGPSAVAVIIFEILLNGSAMFNHSNISLPRLADKFVRTLFVTPDMHRVHHSQKRYETDSNYGFSLSCWDRIFKTYRPYPEDGQLGMKIGLTELQSPESICSLRGMLILPFKRPSK